MTRSTGVAALLLILFCVAAGADGAEVKPSPLLGAMAAELERTMVLLKDQPQPPYFLSYEATDTHDVTVSASFGALDSSDENRSRLLDIDLRVGSHELDSTHAIRGDRYADMFDRFSMVELPLGDDPDAIRSVIWYHTDRRYKRAVEKFTQVKTNVAVKVEEEDRSADFSSEDKVVWLEPPASISVDRGTWEDKVRRYSAVFASAPFLLEGGAHFSASRENRVFVNSEGTRVQDSRISYRLYLSAETKADDGMDLPRYESFFAFTEDGLPSDEVVLAAARRMVDDLKALREAPIVEPYTGPAILSGRAAGVFFHEIFGHRIEGQRQRLEDDAQTFKKMLGQRILPETFSVVFDPGRREAAGTALSGAYRFDNQGVPGRRVAVVENGVLKTFLMSRKPVEGIARSNGHGRKATGFVPTARQSNLLVEVRGAVGREELKRKLIERVTQEGKAFGLLFDDIQGGFTFTGRSIPNAFNVIPVMVYRVYPDGREELVRGVDLIGTPLTAFSRIVAADDRPEVFNGTCGAESGGVPVAAVSPALLVDQIEVQKKEKSQDRPPLLPAPVQPAAAGERQ